MTKDITHDDLTLDDARRIDGHIQAIVRAMEEDARRSRDVIEQILRSYPLRHVREGGAEKLRVVLKAETEESLRDLCEAVAGVDGHALDDDALLATLAMAVLRGPDELRRLALEEEEERRAEGLVVQPSRTEPPFRPERKRASRKRRPRKKRRR